MPGYNRTILAGNLTRDPQLKTLPSKTNVCEFGMAVNRKYTTQTGEDREDVLFIDCAAFGNVADVIQQYCTKGKPILVEGRLKLDTWEDKQGGGKRSKISLVVDNFQFIGGRDAASDDTDQRPAPSRQQSTPYPRNRETARQAAISQPPFEEHAQFKEADIPF